MFTSHSIHPTLDFESSSILGLVIAPPQAAQLQALPLPARVRRQLRCCQGVSFGQPASESMQLQLCYILRVPFLPPDLLSQNDLRIAVISHVRVESITASPQRHVKRTGHLFLSA